MNFDPNSITSGLILLLLGVIIRMQFTTNKHLAALNGAVGQEKEWRSGHMKLDDEREVKTDDRLKGLEHKK